MVHSSIWASVWLVNEADITKRRVARGVAEVHQAAFRQQDDPLAVRELISSTCGLMLVHLKFLQAGDLDLVVEVADVADDGPVLHRPHVVER